MLWKVRGPTHSLACTSSGCRKIESEVLHCVRRRDSGSCALACGTRLQGIITGGVQAEVLLGRLEPNAGNSEFALDSGNRSSFRKIQAAMADNVGCDNLMIFQWLILLRWCPAKAL